MLKSRSLKKLNHATFLKEKKKKTEQKLTALRSNHAKRSQFDHSRKTIRTIQLISPFKFVIVK